MTDKQKAQRILDQASRVMAWHEACELESVVEDGEDRHKVLPHYEKQFAAYLNESPTH